MLVVTDYSDNVKKLLMEEEITNLNIIGALNYLEHPSIYVDDKEKPTGVFINANGLYYLYTREMNFVDKVLKQFCIKGEYVFSGVKREITDYIKERYTPIWENPCDIYYYPHKEVDCTEIVSDVRCIPEEEAEMIDHFYTYHSAESLEEIKENLKKRPSSGVYVENALVCWVMVHEDDSMGIMYTKEAHRRKGYAEEVTLDLMHQLLKQGKTPYVQIFESNNMSPGLASKCGFVKAGKCSWFEINTI